MENKFLQAKNYNPIPDYLVNTFIDAKDSVNHWCVGQIVEIDEEKNMIKIHFEGWSPRYDEVSIPRPNFTSVDQTECAKDRTFQETH